MYDEFYYWINLFLVKLNRSKTPASDAILILIMIQAENIFTVMMAVHVKYVQMEKDVTIGAAILMFIILFYINQTFLLKRKEVIFKKIAGYSDRKRTTSLILFWIYLFFSIASFIAIGLYRQNSNEASPLSDKSNNSFFK